MQGTIERDRPSPSRISRIVRKVVTVVKKEQRGDRPTAGKIELAEDHTVVVKEETPAGTSAAEKVELVEDPAVYYHEGGDLFAEDIERNLAELPEITISTGTVNREDLHVGNPDCNTPEEIKKLWDIIWKRRHLLIGKGNALPPAAIGAMCDIDVGDAKPIAQ